MRMYHPKAALLIASLLAFSISLCAAEPNVDFLTVIKPILESSCVKCHGLDRFHGLRLDTKELAFEATGDQGMLIVPGKPEKSTLYTTSVLPDNDPIAMPPRDRDKLSKEQAEKLKSWIEQGAKWPENVSLKRVDKAPFTLVASVLQQSCFKCHSKNKAEGGLRLDNRDAAFKGATSGVVIVPYLPESSQIFTTLVPPTVHDKFSPRLLTPEDVSLIREWVRQGAAWPDDMAKLTD